VSPDGTKGGIFDDVPGILAEEYIQKLYEKGIIHTGGVAGEDITQGLPRVEELFEARKPKGLAIISEIKGTVKISETKKREK